MTTLKKDVEVMFAGRSIGNYEVKGYSASATAFSSQALTSGWSVTGATTFSLNRTIDLGDPNIQNATDCLMTLIYDLFATTR
jgi:hypothetical protein